MKSLLTLLTFCLLTATCYAQQPDDSTIVVCSKDVKEIGINTYQLQIPNWSIKTVDGTTYTITNADNYRVLVFTNKSAITVNIGLEPGTRVQVLTTGGVITFQGTGLYSRTNMRRTQVGSMVQIWGLLPNVTSLEGGLQR